MAETLPPLVTPADVAGMPNPPSDDDLEAMGDAIRAECGWHIAPEVAETLVLDSDGQDALVLPTGRLGAVTAVRYWNGTNMVPLSGWDAQTGWSAQRTSVYKAGGFPAGRRRLEVDVVHGYPSVPKGLLAGVLRLLAGPSRQDVASETLPGHAIAFNTASATQAAAAVLTTSGALTPYKLGPRP